jgi:hypothetical protein
MIYELKEVEISGVFYRRKAGFAEFYPLYYWI